MCFVSRLSAPNMTSGHGDIEKLVRKWCSTNHTASKPTSSARMHCCSVSSMTAWSSRTGRCISNARLRRMRYWITECGGGHDALDLDLLAVDQRADLR